jgi:hypothetical protein
MKEYGGAIFETRCVFCDAKVGRPAGCGEGRHCHFCRKPETHAADPCLPGQAHYWVRGHEFQPVPVR